MSVRAGIRNGGLCLAGAFLVLTTVSVTMEHSLAASGESERLMAAAIHNHMQADMAHDAIRSAVFRVLHGAIRGDVRERDSAVAEIAEFGGDMHKAVDANRALPLDADIKAGLAVIAGQLDTYIDSAATLAHAAQQDPARGEAMAGEFDKAFRALEASQDAQAQRIEARMSEVTAHAQMLETVSLIAVLVLSLLFGAGLYWALRQLNRMVVDPLVDLSGQLDTMTRGDFDIALEAPRGNDEVAAIQQAAIAFRDAGRDRQKAERELAEVVTALGRGLDALSDGDLTNRIRDPFAAKYEELRAAFNRSGERLTELLAGAMGSAASVATGATQIRAASNDLAQRNQLQAASVEESAAALTQISHAVSVTAQSAREVQRSIVTAHAEATDGGAVVVRAMAAMADIERSSQEISQIIGVIDGIAFQTNLLALNAGVEAARAGEAGKGFAVVATEVRALAQRAADAANSIKVLITGSTQQVGSGVALVGETGTLLKHIVERVAAVSASVSTIADSAESQSDTIQQVSGTVSGLDLMTQQNAAMVEQATAAANSLADEAGKLQASISRFRTGEGGAQPVALAAVRNQRYAAPRPQVRGNLALSQPAPAGDWDEF